nr:PhnD/SsuA/transferrin family substrate-binding protein [uncultured Desulfuromonas sp.]
MRRKPITTSALGWIVFFSIAFCPHGVWSSSLVFGVHPYLSSTELSARFTPLCDYLSTQLGQEVKLKIAVTFDALIDQLIAGKVDVAFMGSSNYVLLKQRCDHITLLGKLKGRQPYLRGALVVRHDSGIKTVAQLAGKRLAFVSPNSTMGYGVTTYVLVEAGIYAQDLAARQFLKNHENVAYAVLAGFFDAGSVKQEIVMQPCFKELRVLAPLPEVADHLFVAGPSVSPSLAKAVSQALLTLDEQNEHGLLQRIRDDVVAIVPVEDWEYDPLRNYQRAIRRFEAGP